MTGITDAVWDFLSTQGFQPHGICLLWRPDVFWTHLVSDLLIAAAYFGIPAAIFAVARKRRDLPFGWLLQLFIAFIVCCGITHLFGAWTLWVPDYSLQAIAKVVTAFVSLGTAIALWPQVPKLLALPSHSQLERANRQLAEQVEETQRAQREIATLNRDLERRVAERTAEIEDTNRRLHEEIARRSETEEILRASRGQLEVELQRRQKAEQEARSAAAEAATANQTKSAFLANMSHELRTPLNAIIGFADVLKSEIGGPLGDPSYRGYAIEIHRSGKHLLQVINDILDISRIELGKLDLRMGVIDTAALVAESVALVRWRGEENGVAIEWRAAGRLPALEGDETRLKQVLINLLDNAIKFSPAGGRVTVEAEAVGDGEVAFKVTDTGVGIASEDMPMALAPFGQIDNSLSRQHQGAGLGLPLAKKLVEMHGGRLEIASRPGKGTSIRFTLPARQAGGDGSPRTREHAVAGA